MVRGQFQGPSLTLDPLSQICMILQDLVIPTDVTLKRCHTVSNIIVDTGSEPALELVHTTLQTDRDLTACFSHKVRKAQRTQFHTNILYRPQFCLPWKPTEVPAATAVSLTTFYEANRMGFQYYWRSRVCFLYIGMIPQCSFYPCNGWWNSEKSNWVILQSPREI